MYEFEEVTDMYHLKVENNNVIVENWVKGVVYSVNIPQKEEEPNFFDKLLSFFSPAYSFGKGVFGLLVTRSKSSELKVLEENLK